MNDKVSPATFNEHEGDTIVDHENDVRDHGRCRPVHTVSPLAAPGRAPQRSNPRNHPSGAGESRCPPLSAAMTRQGEVPPIPSGGSPLMRPARGRRAPREFGCHRQRERETDIDLATSRRARWRSTLARPRARRNQLRTVEGGSQFPGDPAVAMASTALTGASPRVSTASLRRAGTTRATVTVGRLAGACRWRASPSATWEPSRWRMSRDRAP